MALVKQGDGLLIQGGALASGSGCCCGGGPCDPATCPNGTECQPPCVCVDGQCVTPPCSGPCDGENPCPEGCACVDGECVGEKGCCCINGEAVQGFSEQECEACNTTYTCSEFMQLEDPSQPCPEGWQPGGEGFCLRSTVVESCEQCAGTCLTQQTGNCGTWIEGSDTCAGYQGFAQVTEPSGTLCLTHDCHTFYVGPNGVFRSGQVFPVFDWCDDDPIDPDPNADNSGRLASFQKAGFFENQEECAAALQAAMEDNPPPEGCVFYNFYCGPSSLCPNVFP